MSGSVLSATRLSKTFRPRASISVEAVKSVDLVLGRGEVVLIMGPSGSGKTTLLSVLGCLLAPSSGRLEVTGREVSSLDERKLTALRRGLFGFVFQNHHLIDPLTVAENVELPLNLVGVRRPDSRRRALDLLAELGLEQRAAFFPRRLSGGEKQRVAIARALVLDPPIVLADEPTGSLDAAARAVVMEMLREAASDRGKAVLIVSHDTRLGPYADRILRMEDGFLAAEPEVG